MGRFAFLVLVLAACPKTEKEALTEPLGSNAPPPTGRSVTKVNEDGAAPGDGGLAGKLEKLASGSGKTKGDKTGEPKAGTQDAGENPDAAPGKGSGSAELKLYGGNGAPPYVDDEGHLHGPGGPIFMGKGVECNAERDHCMRAGVWFAVGNLVAGKLYRAVPIFEHDKKWFNWRGREESFAMRFKTKVGTKATIKAGDPIIWFIDENASKKFVDNEYDALTSSRWEAGVVDEVMADKIRVKGWTYGAASSNRSSQSGVAGHRRAWSSWSSVACTASIVASASVRSGFRRVPASGSGRASSVSARGARAMGQGSYEFVRMTTTFTDVGDYLVLFERVPSS